MLLKNVKTLDEDLNHTNVIIWTGGPGWRQLYMGCPNDDKYLEIFGKSI
jgi:hypothetical protein